MRPIRNARNRADGMRNGLGLKQTDWFVEAKKNQADAECSER